PEAGQSRLVPGSPSMNTVGLPTVTIPMPMKGLMQPAASPRVSGTTDPMLSAGTNERKVLIANGTAIAFIARLGYGTGTPRGGVAHTSGKHRFIPTPWLHAGSIAASYPRWISLPLMLMVSS